MSRSVSHIALLALLLAASPALARDPDHDRYHGWHDRDGVVDNSLDTEHRRIDTQMHPVGPTAAEISQRREQERRQVWLQDHREAVPAPVPPPFARPESPRWWHGYSQAHYDRHYEPVYHAPPPQYRFRDRDRVVIHDYWVRRYPRYHYYGPAMTFTVGQYVPETVYVEPAPVELVETLQPVPYGYRYVVAGNNILLVDPYGVIVDVVDL